MPESERTIVINQPVSAVSPVVADGGRGALWRPDGEPYDVTVAEPERRLLVRFLPTRVPFSGDPPPTGEIELEPMGGGTILTMRLRVDLPGWRRLLAARGVQRALDAEMAALDRLRDLLER